MKEAASAMRSRHQPHLAVSGGEGGLGRGIEGIRYASRLINQEHGDGGESTDGVLIGGQANDSGAVGKFERIYAEFPQKAEDFSAKFARLAQGGRTHDH